MKNHLTLVVASFLLILCVLERQASDKAVKNVNVENMFNFPNKNFGNDQLASQMDFGREKDVKSLYNPAPLFELTSLDSISNTGQMKLVKQNLLNIASGSKMLNY
ncbi:hypothetical protein [Dyadobacter arcticus]|uniref:Uncharacterized protein n=1 Tax=Dyadobacter arcticus TaxID=1078754 RepID=A0ABX0USU1_9BACT|nr:hypothetical protein [Dyadobacter arcticus]NIJ56042.1 hypothetical protein [Dyadobacter arcticus]